MRPLQLRPLSVRLKFACLGHCDNHGGLVHVAVAATCSSGHGVPQFVSPFFGHFSKAMDLRRKIDQMACLESDGEQEKVKKMGVAKCVHVWRRLVLALSTMLVTARQQAVVDYLAKRAHQNDENEEHSKNKSQRSQVRKPQGPRPRDSSGHRKATSEITGAEALGPGGEGMSTSGGTSAVPGKSTRFMVDMPAVRSPVGTVGDSSECFVIEGAGSPASQETPT